MGRAYRLYLQYTGDNVLVLIPISSSKLFKRQVEEVDIEVLTEMQFAMHLFKAKTL